MAGEVLSRKFPSALTFLLSKREMVCFRQVSQRGRRFRLPVVMGHTADFRSKPAALLTHDWVFYVRPLKSSCSLKAVVDKVVLTLHPSFEDVRRVLAREPFELHESGYGSFELKAKIIFKEPTRRSVKILYDLRLNDPGECAVAESRVEYVDFVVPPHQVQLFGRAGARPLALSSLSGLSTMGQAVPKIPVPLVAPHESSSDSRPPAGSSRVISRPEKRSWHSTSAQPPAKKAKFDNSHCRKHEKPARSNIEYLNQLCHKFERSTCRGGLSRGPGRPSHAEHSRVVNERRQAGASSHRKQTWRKHASTELNSSGREMSSSEGVPSPVSQPLSPANAPTTSVTPVDLLCWNSNVSGRTVTQRTKPQRDIHQSGSMLQAHRAPPHKEKKPLKTECNHTRDVNKKLLKSSKPSSTDDKVKRMPRISHEKSPVSKARLKSRQYTRTPSQAAEIDPDSPEVDQNCQCCTGNQQCNGASQDEGTATVPSRQQLVKLQTSIAQMTDSNRLQAIVDLIEPFSMLSAVDSHVQFDLCRLPPSVVDQLQSVLAGEKLR